MNKNQIRQLAVVLATLMMIIINGLATVIPINNKRTAEIAESFDIFFIPAGYVFSIWALIYLGLLAYSVYQALPAQREDSTLQKIGYLYVYTCAANISWLVFWHYEVFVLSLIVIMALLGLLSLIYLQLGVCRNRVSKAEKWLVHIPFSVYLGWIIIAAISNLALVLDFFGWNGWGINQEVWALLMLTIAILISGIMIFTRGDIAFTLVFIWAFVGIAIQNHSATMVAAGAWVGALFAGISIFIETGLKRDPC